MPLPQLTRQWIILQELAASRLGRTLQYLAQTGEVNERTARRDLYTLIEAGFPIEKDKLGEQTRFRLIPGRPLPLIPLDTQEALTLYLAAISSPLYQTAGCRLQNPVYSGQQIRFELDTQSGLNWTANPILSGHFFRFSGFGVQIVSD